MPAAPATPAAGGNVLIAHLWRATRCLSFLVFPLAMLPGRANAQQAESRDWWQKIRDKADQITAVHQNDLYLSGYIHHGRNTYTAERIRELNERHAWGAGVGKTLRNDGGDEESLFAFGFSDSHFKPQLMAGYAHLWSWPLLGSGLEVAGGYTALMISRADMYSGVPFPAVLPVGAIGTSSAKLMATYVPRLSRDGNNGDVLFFFARFSFD
ncbi:hypothetical protein ACFQAT_03305 [Undibacterium arcticum]|uniref:Lipid A palmitoyltransferase PagP n=1 Tax=Undibacterium arcticum TaxID=1762892 RepID=A0ABV7F368_9BURK